MQRELLGIGAIKAQRLWLAGGEYGNSASTDELLEMRGIGEATLEENRQKLLLADA